MKILFYLFIFVLLIGVNFYYVNIPKKEIIPTIQYTKPIGPTQSYPHIIDSKLERGINLDG